MSEILSWECCTESYKDVDPVSISRIFMQTRSGRKLILGMEQLTGNMFGLVG